MKTILTLIATVFLFQVGFSQFEYDKLYQSGEGEETHHFFKIYKDGTVIMVETADVVDVVKTYFSKDEPNEDSKPINKCQSKIKEDTKASFVITLDDKKVNCIAQGHGKTVSVMMIIPGTGKKQLEFKLVE